MRCDRNSGFADWQLRALSSQVANASAVALHLLLHCIAVLAGSLLAQGAWAHEEALAFPSVAAAPKRSARETDQGLARGTGPFARLESAGMDLHQRNLLIIGGSGAAFAAYGRAKWWDQGFAGGFKTAGEGWFGQGTDYGGTDKLGHMFTNYASTRLLAPVFEAAGNSRENAVRLAGWTTLGIFTGIEVIDGLSRNWRFSPEDALMNAAGVGLGVLMETEPFLDRKFDFRFAYRRSRGSAFDPFGDYSGQRYLLVVKADGFEQLRSRPLLRYLELGIGYQARFTPGGERRRDAYVGISLNLSRLLADAAYDGRKGTTPFQRAAETTFELFQFPAAAYGRYGLD